MKSKTNLSHAELLKSQNSANDSNEHKEASSELFQKEKLENSPIQVVRTGNKWFAGLGIQKISPDFDTKEELMKHTESWEFMVSLITAAILTILERKDEILKTTR